MKRSRFKNSITLFLLALFVTTKMGGLHVLTHANDKEHVAHCLICDHIIAHNITPVLAPDFEEYEINIVQFLVKKEIQRDYEFVLSHTIPINQLFSRPPPGESKS